MSPDFEKKALKRALEKLTFEDFQSFLLRTKWVEKGRFVWFAHGNLEKTFAIELVEKARAIIIGSTEA